VRYLAWVIVGGNLFISVAVAIIVNALLPGRLPETIECKELKTESVRSGQTITGYLNVRIPGSAGRTGSVTLNAGEDWAGMNVSDGKTVQAFWVEERFGHQGVVKPKE